jgi:hypothetical protein
LTARCRVRHLALNVLQKRDSQVVRKGHVELSRKRMPIPRSTRCG